MWKIHISLLCAANKADDLTLKLSSSGLLCARVHFTHFPQSHPTTHGLMLLLLEKLGRWLLHQQLRFACCQKGFLRLIKNIEMQEYEYVLRLASLALAMQ